MKNDLGLPSRDGRILATVRALAVPAQAPGGGFGRAACPPPRKFAWFSLISVALTDLYIRLVSMGIIHDLRLL
jgi:hypothetical protein